MKMTHGSLFSGIGGFDLAAKWVGWKNVFQCEINPFCQQILKYHFPKCKLFTDIKTTNFSKYANKIDVISGGFPCQPFSSAGKRRGTKDDRFLWGEMFRVISEVSPKWVVAENVSGLLTQESGMVFEQLCSDLENSGYEVLPIVIPACAVGAPHRRDRLWIVAHRNSIERTERRANSKQQKENETEWTNFCCQFERFGKKQVATDTNSIGSAQSVNECETVKFAQNIPDWRNFPTQSPICGGDDGLPEILDGITFPKWRRKTIEAYGNAIVPQVAYQIFKTIDYINKNFKRI